MNKKEFIEFAVKLGKLLGANPTMDNYTFSDPKSPVFQIKEKELRSVVRKAKALKDKEAHGIEDIEWDFEEGYICFMLPGGFALYLSTEADMEMNESSNAALLKLAQTASKALGIKFKETPSSYKAIMGASFEITEKDFIKIVKEFKRAQSDPAAFGFYEMTFDNPEMSVLIDFEDEEDGILFYVGGMNESLQNELDFGNAIMKHLGIKGKQIGRTNVFEVSGRDRMKIDKLKANDELGDIIIFGVKDDNYSTNLEVKTYLMPKTVTVKFTDEAEMFESSAVNEATNTLNEASEARMRKKARDIAKFFGVEIDETVGSFGFFASSAGIDKSSYNKIIKIINQTKDIEKKLGVNFVEVWSKVNSIRFNVYRSEDDIFFKLQGMNESEIPAYTPRASNEMNESEVELNEVTGLPKHKTLVPSHLL